jgi:hypothetical protein
VRLGNLHASVTRRPYFRTLKLTDEVFERSENLVMLDAVCRDDAISRGIELLDRSSCSLGRSNSQIQIPGCFCENETASPS